VDSVPEHSQPEICDSCLYPAEDLVKHAGDRLCERCRAVFLTAQVLFEEGISDEADIVDTLSYAALDGRPWELRGKEACEKFAKTFPRRYEDFELVRVVDGVPVLRLKLVRTDVIRYQGTDVPKQVRIRVLSRFVKPESVADSYERTLLVENLSWDHSTDGFIKWNATATELSVTVGPNKLYRPGRARSLANNPPECLHSFPPPDLIKEVYPALLGSTDKRTRRGYAYALGKHGRFRTKEAKSVILACAAWYIGERDQKIEPKDRRPRIARMLNRHLLAPVGESMLCEDGWTPENRVWGDAARLSDNLQQAWYFLQQERDS
jgi:hypothetical protein